MIKGVILAYFQTASIVTPAAEPSNDSHPLKPPYCAAQPCRLVRLLF